MHDPFEQFERSRSGLVIPLLLFLAGAVPTAVGISAMISVRADQEVAGEVDAPHLPAADQADQTSADLSQNSQDKSDP